MRLDTVALGRAVWRMAQELSKAYVRPAAQGARDADSGGDPGTTAVHRAVMANVGGFRSVQRGRGSAKATNARPALPQPATTGTTQLGANAQAFVQLMKSGGYQLGVAVETQEASAEEAADIDALLDHTLGVTCESTRGFTGSGGGERGGVRVMWTGTFTLEGEVTVVLPGRILMLRLRCNTDQRVWTLVAVYMPQVGSSARVLREAWEALVRTMATAGPGALLTGDLNVTPTLGGDREAEPGGRELIRLRPRRSSG